MGGADDPQLEILLACFDGHKRAGTIHRALGRRIKGHGGAFVDEVVVRVNHKGAVQTSDPHRDVAGTLTSALTWGLFGLLATGGWSGLLVWAVLGAVCGGLYAFYTEHLLKKNDFKRIGTRLAPDSSALLLYVHGTKARGLLDDVAPEDPRLSSVATIDADLSATVAQGAQQAAEPPSAAVGRDASNRSLLNMLVFRYSGEGSAASVHTRAVTAQAHTTQPTIETELLLRADKRGRYHVVSPTAGIRAFMPSDAVAWGLFGVVVGGIVGYAGNGSVLGLTEGAVVTGILWAIFGLVAGTLYGLWVGRAISARRMKPLRQLLPPDTSIALCWADGPLTDEGLTEWTTTAADQLILEFHPIAGGATLDVRKAE
jgi:uncharacterized membrane protein